MKPILIQDQKANDLINQQVKTLMDNHSFTGGRIAGSQIIHFSSHKQVNLFILFQIYQDWSGQVNNMVHPYFDFSHEEVKSALRNFQNVLSKHIVVKKDDFAPLVQKAVYNTLRLIIDPIDSLGKFYFKGSEKVPLALFQKHSAYFSDFDFAIQSIAKFYEKNGIPEVNREDFFQKFEKIIGIFENKEGVEIKAYQEKLFQKAFGMEASELATTETPVEETPRRPSFQTPRQEPLPKYSPPPTQPKINPVQTEPKEPKTPMYQKPASPVTPEPIPVPKPLPEPEVKHTPPAKPVPNPPVEATGSSKEEAQIPLPKPEPEVGEEKTVAPPILEKPVEPAEPQEEIPMERSSAPIDLFSSPEEEDSEAKSILGQEKNAPTLGDRLKQSSGAPNLHQSITSGSGGGSTSKKLAESIPVHKQFQFVQKLFGGSSVKFKVVLEKLEETNSFQDGEGILNRYVFNNPDVNRDTKLAQELVDLVKGQY